MLVPETATLVQFSDPRRFDISRSEGSHLGFALGRHHCIGALDAEQAGRVALTAFLKTLCATLGLRATSNQRSPGGGTQDPVPDPHDDVP